MSQRKVSSDLAHLFGQICPQSIVNTVTQRPFSFHFIRVKQLSALCNWSTNPTSIYKWTPTASLYVFEQNKNRSSALINI